MRRFNCRSRSSSVVAADNHRRFGRIFLVADQPALVGHGGYLSVTEKVKTQTMVSAGLTLSRSVGIGALLRTEAQLV